MTVSTAHKAKGREWPCVKIADDFTPPQDPDQHDDARPAPYPHPSTTARPASPTSPSPAPAHRLDLGGLSWIHEHPHGTP